MDRLQLQAALESILGSRNVYFQPPPTVQLAYPCILYERNPERDRPADDIRYLQERAYTVTVVDRSPESQIPADILDRFRHSRIDRYYAADNLNHCSITLYI